MGAEGSLMPDNLASEARTELQRGLRLFKAFEHADRALAMLEGLEQLTHERKADAERAMTESQEAHRSLEGARAELTAAKAEAKELRKDSKDKAAAKIADAEQTAAGIITAAEARVAALTEEQNNLVADLLEKSQALTAMQAQLEDASALIAKAEKARRALSEV